MNFINRDRNSSYASSKVSAILLDVENFPLKLDLCQYLKGFCEYPIILKLAVANWQNNSIAKLDRDLHLQGYHLIHVPKAKNAADAQIMTLAMTLPLDYPQLKEIVVVSQDTIFNYLHQSLRRQEIATYKVYQQSGNVYLYDFWNDRQSMITKVSQSAPAQIIEQQICSKIEIALSELIANSSNRVNLSQVCHKFKSKYNQTISETLKSNKLPKSTLKFIQQSCDRKIKIEASEQGYFLSLKSF